MDVEMPAGIARYFEAERGRDASAVAECFTANGVVRDEGHAYAGRDAIREWMAGSIAKYSCTAEPFDIAEEGGRIIVASHVVGNFPGSPVDLRYLFTLTADGISGLEIKL